MARRAGRIGGHGWRTIAAYGLLLGVGATLLQWADWRRFARTQTADLWLVLVGLAMLTLGLWLGWRLRAPRAPQHDGAPRAAAFGLSPREYEVLQALADGRSNKEIARALEVSPNTVKTHVARVYEKLDASRRTDAVARARALGFLR